MSSASAIGVLVPSSDAAPELPPEARPIGRAALHLQQQGIDIVFGDTVIEGRMHGFRAVQGGWKRAINVPIVAAHDRFPSQLRASQFADIQAGLGTLPMGNSHAFTMLCRDKLRTQEVFGDRGIGMPPVCADPDSFEDQLMAWGSAFIKPRYGALGVGIKHVRPGDSLPAQSPGIVPERPDPSLLQQAISPPKGWASRTVRVLMQRAVDGNWIHGVPVVRQSRHDPVANAARGAEVAAGTAVLDESVLVEIHRLMDRIGQAIDSIKGSQWALEAGADLVLDSEYKPWLIELNSRPRGRMEVLADRQPEKFEASHIAACCRPIQRLIALTKQES